MLCWTPAVPLAWPVAPRTSYAELPGHLGKQAGRGEGMQCCHGNKQMFEDTAYLPSLPHVSPPDSVAS